MQHKHLRFGQGFRIVLGNEHSHGVPSGHSGETREKTGARAVW
jgi:hypothetical protein